MNFWHMQLHPNNRNWGNEEKLLKDTGLIGLGDWKEKAKKQQNLFENNMSIGDIVLIKRGITPLALVEVTGAYEYSDQIDELIWFQRRRKIKVIDWYKNEYKLTIMPRGTLIRCDENNENAETNKSIYWWYRMATKNLHFENIKMLLLCNNNLILTGAPGTGKTWLAREIAKQMTGDTDNTQGRIGFIQFHPSYDYTDFVEGIKPTGLDGGTVQLNLRDGVFLEFCKKASRDTGGNKYFFIIDEINRADLSRVFGELFFGLESEYRGEPITTQYSYLRTLEEKTFCIPKNVYIIGTMNDIDRSVESMDFALRRRFAWKEITAQDSEIILDSAGLEKEDLDNAKLRMHNLNTEIEKQLGSTAYQIGGAYFRKLVHYKDRDDKFDLLWDNHLKVVLSEYVRGKRDADKIIDAMKTAYTSLQ